MVEDRKTKAELNQRKEEKDDLWSVRNKNLTFMPSQNLDSFLTFHKVKVSLFDIELGREGYDYEQIPNEWSRFEFTNWRNNVGVDEDVCEWEN